jgi:hypothetical protein
MSISVLFTQKTLHNRGPGVCEFLWFCEMIVPKKHDFQIHEVLLKKPKMLQKNVKIFNNFNSVFPPTVLPRNQLSWVVFEFYSLSLKFEFYSGELNSKKSNTKIFHFKCIHVLWEYMWKSPIHLIIFTGSSE